MDAAPPVSCMCMTYGRPSLLEEAIESFLRQDYSGPKELIVLNDLPDQDLRFDHPEVHIINVRKRFHGIGEKRNACAALCSHDWLFVWDDDDIYLPWRLSCSMEMVRDGRRFFKPEESFMLSGGKLTGPSGNVFHSSACWHRSLFDEVGGYAHAFGSGDDIAIEAKFTEALGGAPLSETLPAERNFYVYRWAGTGSFHLSALVQRRKSDEGERAMVEAYVAKQLASGEVATGEIVLRPGWKEDYVEMVARYLSSMTELNPA